MKAEIIIGAVMSVATILSLAWMVDSKNKDIDKMQQELIQAEQANEKLILQLELCKLKSDGDEGL